VADVSLIPRSGLEHLLQAGTHGQHPGEPGVILALRTDLALAYVLARNGKTDALQQRVRGRFGLSLPTTAQHAVDGNIPSLDSLSFIWAGPGRWLARTSVQTGAALEATLRSELSTVASVINQTDGRCVFRIGGPSVRDVLAKGLPIDLDARVFSPGDTALTLVGHVSVHLWQVDPMPTYEFAVPRSFAASFCEWLLAAAASHGLLVRAS
jgi:heterotetrameric sarcosine oxidase gamma subunit